jgi:SAM-dependent methyltransferase
MMPKISNEHENLTDFVPTKELKNRLIEREKRIIGENLDYLKDKKVLDLACNNGRWSYAAAVAGAKEVVGIEGREDKVEEARAFISKFNLDKKVEFQQGDIYDWLFENRETFDTVLCLGIYYHIMDHYMLLRLIARAKPECIIIDSGFIRAFSPYVWLMQEDPSIHLNALPAFSGQKEEVVGHISLGLMNQFAWNCGYKCEPLMWNPEEVDDTASVQDYMMGRRFTLRLTKMNGNEDPDWRVRYYGPLVALNPRFKYLFEEGKEHLAIDDRCK